MGIGTTNKETSGPAESNSAIPLRKGVVAVHFSWKDSYGRRRFSYARHVQPESLHPTDARLALRLGR